MTTDHTIAQTTLQQLGGNKFLAMIGGRAMWNGRALMVNFKARSTNRANALSVTLDDNDTYTVKFMRIMAINCKTVGEARGVYADGLRTSL